MLILSDILHWSSYVCVNYALCQKTHLLGDLFSLQHSCVCSLFLRAFFWLVSLLLSSLVWFISVQISDKESAAQQKGLLIFGVVLSVVLQETFRFAYYKLLKCVSVCHHHSQRFFVMVFLAKSCFSSVYSHPKRPKLFDLVVLFGLGVFLPFYWISEWMSRLHVTYWCCVRFMSFFLLQKGKWRPPHSQPGGNYADLHSAAGLWYGYCVSVWHCRCCNWHSAGFTVKRWPVPDAPSSLTMMIPATVS